MATSRALTATQRNNFRRIIAQLDRARTDKKVLDVVQQATKFLNENDVDWDVVSIVVKGDYVFRSQRQKWKPTKMTPTAAAVTAAAVNGASPVLGRDGRALLKKAVAAHPDWLTVRDTLSIDISHISIGDLIAIAQILKINEQFIKLFIDQGAEEHQPDLPFGNGSTSDPTE